MYSLTDLLSAQRQLGRLDSSVAIRIKRKLDWLIENIESLDPEGLRHGLAGLAQIREGDYRIIYERLDAEQLIIVHSIGHRSEIYKD